MMGGMEDPSEHSERDAWTVFLMILYVGTVLLLVADRLVRIGPAVGNLIFVALPLLAAIAASARLEDHD